MPILRKSGARSPWLPAPLQANTDPLRQTIVISMVVPLLVVGANAQFVSRPAPPEDVSRPARPAIVQTVPVPLPTTAQWMPSAARLPNTDPLHPPALQADPPDATLAQPNTTVVGRLPRPEDTAWPARPATVQGAPVPVPGASVWAPSAARLPNSDPLHPPSVVADPPDATLQQPTTTWLSRLPRPEDPNWPARPAVIQSQPPPLPGGLARPITAPRDQVVALPDRLSPPIVLADPPDATLAQSATMWIGRLSRPEDTNWPARPAIVQSVPVPLPGAAVWMPSAARLPNSDPLRPPLLLADPPDATLVQSAAVAIGRLSRPEDVAWPARPAIVVGVSVSVPGASVWAPSAARLPNSDPMRPPTVRGAAQPHPPGMALATTAPRDQAVAPPDRLSPPIVLADVPDATLAQGALAWVGRPARDEDTTRPARPAIVVGAPSLPPGALIRTTAALRDQVAAQPDRVTPAVVRVGQQPVPVALARSIGVVWEADRPGRAPLVVSVAPPRAPAQAIWLAFLHDDGTTVVGLVPLHGTRSAQLHGTRDHTLSGDRDAELHGTRATDLSGRRGRRLTKR